MKGGLTEGGRLVKPSEYHCSRKKMLVENLEWWEKNKNKRKLTISAVFMKLADGDGGGRPLFP